MHTTGGGPLAHPVRRAIEDYIRAHPGVHLSELGEALGLGWGNLLHHVDVLERARLVAEARQGNRRRLFVQERFPDPATRLRYPATDTTADDLFALILAEPGIDQGALALRSGRSRRTVRKHLERLVATGRVEARREGRHLRHFAL